MKTRTVLSGVALILCLAGCASEPSGAPHAAARVKPVATAQESGSGAASASPSKDWDETTDYTAIRYEYASRPGYNPYAAQLFEKIAVDDAMKDWREGRNPDTLDKLWKLVDLQPLSIEAHRRLADGIEIILPSRTDPKLITLFKELEHHHRVIYNGLVQSILKSGDGQTAKTAYKVISIPEERWALFELKLTEAAQALATIDGRSYDILTVRTRDGKDAGVLYFDVNLLHKFK